MKHKICSKDYLAECLLLCGQEKQLSSYYDIYSRMGMTDEALRLLYDVGKAETYLANQMVNIRCGEDNWRLFLDDSGKHVKLYHNSYSKTFDGDRWFSDDFHDQFPKVKNLTAEWAVKSIVGYHWDGHPQDVKRILKRLKRR